MTAQSGTLVLIKVGNGANPEVFTTVGGLRTSKIVLNNLAMDTTNLESGPWKQLLGNAGINYMTIDGTGLFTNSAAEETVRGYAFAASANNYKFVFANGNNVTGPFIVTAYERSGNHDAEEIYSLALESAGGNYILHELAMEANIILGGKAYPLRPTFDTLCHIEKKLAATITELTVKLTEGTMTLEELAIIVIKSVEPEIPDDDVREVLLGNGLAHATKAVAVMFSQIFSGTVTNNHSPLAMQRAEFLDMKARFPD